MTTEGDQSPGNAGLAETAPGWIDPSRSSVARLHDVLLGGKDNFQADRDVRDQLLAIDPEVCRATRDIREFTARVTRFLASEAGVSQFLNLGPTMPTAENAHEVAQRRNREASMVYVTMDPSLLAHGRALLADNDHTHMAEADLRRPRQVMENEAVVKHIDLTRPVAVYHIGTLHHINDKHDPVGMIAAYMAAVPSGSYLALALAESRARSRARLAARQDRASVPHGRAGRLPPQPRRDRGDAVRPGDPGPRCGDAR